MRRLTLLALFCAAAVGGAPAGAEWQLIQVPGRWGEIGDRELRRYDDFAWYRCFVRVPADWRGQPLQLNLGMIDECDETFLNGERLSATGRMPPQARTAWRDVRRYPIPPDRVRCGEHNMICVRVLDIGGEGGMTGPQLSISSDKGKLSLEGNWQFRKGDNVQWAAWPADPDSPEAKKLMTEYEANADGVGEPGIVYVGEAAAPDGDLTLWYRRPAQSWEEEALPIGNGRLGAMVFGGIHDERIQLNADSLWSGEPIERDKEGAAEHLDDARKLLFDGDYGEAEKLVQEKMMGLRIEPGLHTYQTLGNLELEFEKPTEVRNYRRSLDLDTAIARVEYQVDGAKYTREVFSSAPDDVVVVRLACDQPGRITFDCGLSRPENVEIATAGSDRIIMTGGFPDGKGVDFEAQVKVVVEGGAAEASGDTVRVESADAATILIAGATGYWGDDPHAECERAIEAAAAKEYSELRADHINDHQRLFRRVSLDLGRSGFADLPTDERLQQIADGADDPGIVRQYFQFGRYLLIGCSRPGTMPANLQGLWAEGLNPPWNADYHININMQMNYWPAEVCNLSECHLPFFEFVQQLRPRGRVTARKTYGCGGFVAHHTTDAWHFTSPIGRAVYGMWPTGGAWCLRRFWLHYLYTGDRDFLRDEAYPAMKEAVEFLCEYLAEDPDTGYLVSGPSTSPENAFRTEDGQVAHITMGPTMDQQIIFELFDNFVKASALLGMDSALRERAEDCRDKLAPTRIGSDGRIMEWCEEFEEPEPGHRHISHLFGLHPDDQITPETTPELAKAARNTLEYRLSHGGGHTGWSRAWIVNCFARLNDGQKACEHLQALLARSTTPNMLDTHPPFQIDGNFGGCAGIAEMLLQSCGNMIKPLPALPDAWPEGSVQGLCAEGGFEVDITWQDGALESAGIESKLGNTCRVHAGAPIAVTCGGEQVTTESDEGGAVEFETEAGKVYEIRPAQ